MNPEVRILAAYSEQLKEDYGSEMDSMWDGSPFARSLTRPSRQKGAIVGKPMGISRRLSENLQA